MNTLFYTYGTKCSCLINAEHYYPYIENNNGGEGTEFHVGIYKKRRQFIYRAFVFDLGLYYSPDELLQKDKHLHKFPLCASLRVDMIDITFRDSANRTLVDTSSQTIQSSLIT